MRVLIINSDLAANRGDRAIADGLIALVRDTLPSARITLISQYPDRDREWYNADVLPQNIHSLNPLDMVRLMRAAKQADLVLWGGGELLKDYTNRLGVWYWAVKMWCVSAANKTVVGTFQGIGPTSAKSSRRLIARTVIRTKAFLTRDAESKEKLEAWGVPAGHVIASFDSAVYADGSAVYGDGSAVYGDGSANEHVPFESYAAIAPRSWFHYSTGGWLPHRWRRTQGPAPRALQLESRVVEMIDTLVEAHGAAVVVPMHMAEDPELAARLLSQVARPDRVHVLSDDDLSPQQLRSVIAGANVMIALRLHAGIIATAASVPTVTYYYVDKGRLFAHQAGTDQVARPIEALLEASALVEFSQLATQAVAEGSAGPDERIGRMKAQLKADFEAALKAASIELERE